MTSSTVTFMTATVQVLIYTIHEKENFRELIQNHHFPPNVSVKKSFRKKGIYVCTGIPFMYSKAFMYFYFNWGFEFKVLKIITSHK